MRERGHRKVEYRLGTSGDPRLCFTMFMATGAILIFAVRNFDEKVDVYHAG